jgi:hypothetical protein
MVCHAESFHEFYTNRFPKAIFDTNCGSQEECVVMGCNSEQTNDQKKWKPNTKKERKQTN